MAWVKKHPLLGPVVAGPITAGQIELLFTDAHLVERYALIRAREQFEAAGATLQHLVWIMGLMKAAAVWLKGSSGAALQRRGVKLIVAMSNKDSSTNAYADYISRAIRDPFAKEESKPAFLISVDLASIPNVMDRTRNFLTTLPELELERLNRVLGRKLDAKTIEEWSAAATLDALNLMLLHEAYHILRGHLWPSAFWSKADGPCYALPAQSRFMRRVQENDADFLASVHFAMRLEAQWQLEAAGSDLEKLMRGMLGILALFDALAGTNPDPTDCYHCPTVRARGLVGTLLARWKISLETNHHAQALLVSLLSADATRHGLTADIVEADMQRWEETEKRRIDLEKKGAFAAFVRDQ
jgi:hypothetical protein